MSQLAPLPRWHALIGHALTVLALSLGGLSSFHALKADVVELRATLHALVQIESEHYHRGDLAIREAGQRRDHDLQQIRDDIKEMRADLRELRGDLKNHAKKGTDQP